MSRIDDFFINKTKNFLFFLCKPNKVKFFLYFLKKKKGSADTESTSPLTLISILCFI